MQFYEKETGISTFLNSAATQQVSGECQYVTCFCLQLSQRSLRLYALDVFMASLQSYYLDLTGPQSANVVISNPANLE